MNSLIYEFVGPLSSKTYQRKTIQVLSFMIMNKILLKIVKMNIYIFKLNHISYKLSMLLENWFIQLKWKIVGRLWIDFFGFIWNWL